MTQFQPRTILYREAVQAALVGLAFNLALGIAKLIAGLAAGSFALISDAVNSLGDVFTSAVVVWALRLAQKPADAEHPYGHSRAEAIAAGNVAVMVAVSAILVAVEAIRRFGQRAEVPPTWTLWLAGANVVIKEALYHYKMRVGRRTGSAALIANAWDHRSDALCSLAVLAGLSALRWGGPRFHSADELAALFVAAAVSWSALGLFRRTASELMDLQADGPFCQQVRLAASGVAGVMGVEKLLLRKSGLEYFADIHIEVDPELTVAAGHQIGHEVKDRLLAEFPTLRDVLVHLEPFAQGRG